jgi:uncharacterized protein YuzE
MQPTYSAENDTLYLRFADAPILESEEMSEGVIFDFDADGRIVAIEFLNASERLASGAV